MLVKAKARRRSPSISSPLPAKRSSPPGCRAQARCPDRYSVRSFLIDPESERANEITGAFARIATVQAAEGNKRECDDKRTDGMYSQATASKTSRLSIDAEPVPLEVDGLKSVEVDALFLEELPASVRRDQALVQVGADRQF